MKTKFILIPLGIILAITLSLSNVAMSGFFKRVFGDHYEIGILHIGPLKLPVSVADYGTKQEIWIRFPEEVWPSYRLSITAWDQTEEDIRVLDRKIQEILEKIRKSAPGYSEEAARKSVEKMKTVQNSEIRHDILLQVYEKAKETGDIKSAIFQYGHLAEKWKITQKQLDFNVSVLEGDNLVKRESEDRITITSQGVHYVEKEILNH
ncbi:hypothetical protein E3J33_04585 [Candidatus Aerophobetes bacterium]|uniref:Uncharacterized protein n=1 Tax=Aerophobetes bacterium TaxID=2030807 RepID=A0A523YJQ9_UNCAE|nr:MAG: hypothetical protein E3J33_04585 [Candidatus Aerophobetes bacterium]